MMSLLGAGMAQHGVKARTLAPLRLRLRARRAEGAEGLRWDDQLVLLQVERTTFSEMLFFKQALVGGSALHDAAHVCPCGMPVLWSSWSIRLM
jgi:hypothetical protein